MEIIKGIQQAAANGFDGGKPGTGLGREEPTPITDRRVIDGFGVRVQGDTLVVNYHQEIPLNKSQPNRLQSDCDQTLEDVVSFLKKEYKNITGSALTLTEVDKESDSERCKSSDFDEEFDSERGKSPDFDADVAAELDF